MQHDTVIVLHYPLFEARTQPKREIPMDINWHHFIDFIWVKSIYSYHL